MQTIYLRPMFVAVPLPDRFLSAPGELCDFCSGHPSAAVAGDGIYLSVP